MSGGIHIGEAERGVVRVFDLALEGDDAKAFMRPGESWPLKDALGADTLDADHAELVFVDDLAGFGLPAYLEEGLGVDPHEIEDKHAPLEALSGAVVILRSGAFGGRAQELHPRAPLRLVASLGEIRAAIDLAPMTSATAQGHIAPGGGAGPGRVGRVWWLTLLMLGAALALALIFLVWG